MNLRSAGNRTQLL